MIMVSLGDIISLQLNTITYHNKSPSLFWLINTNFCRERAVLSAQLNFGDAGVFVTEQWA